MTLAEPSPQEDHVKHLAAIASKVSASLDADLLVYNGRLTGKAVDEITGQMCKAGTPCERLAHRHDLWRRPRRGLLPRSMPSALLHAISRLRSGVLHERRNARDRRGARADPVATRPARTADIQLSHTEEIGERRSGLAPTEALRVLETRARDAYRKSFDEMRGQIGMPTRLAAETATRFVTGLYRTSFAHVDPIRLGEMDRANRIAHQYGERLVSSAGKASNVKDGTLLKLVAEYPSHEFVIDITEARELFKTVREPTREEAALDTVIAMRYPVPTGDAFSFFISAPPPQPKEAQNGSTEPDGATAGSGSPKVGADGPGERTPEPPPVRNRSGRTTSRGNGTPRREPLDLTECSRRYERR